MVSIRKRLVSGGVWAIAGKLIAAIAAVVVNALLARLLAPDAMGAYFLTFSLVSVFAVAAQLGLNHTVVRLVAESLSMQQPQRAAESVRLVLGLGFSGTLVVAAVLAMGTGKWLAEYLFDSDLIAKIMGLAALWVAIMATQGLVAESFRGFHDIRLATVFGGVLTSTLSALLFAGLWSIQGYSDLGQIITFSIVTAATNAVIGFLFLRAKLHPKGPKSDLTARTVLGIAWPIWVTNLTLVALTQADLWVVGMFRGQDDVAIYGAAARFAPLVSMPLLIVNAVVPSLIAELYIRGEKNDLRDALRASATVAVIPAFLVLASFVFLGGPILGIVYGDYYRDGAIVLALLGVGQLVNVWAGSCGMVLLMTGNQTLMMLISVACGVLNISIAVLVVDRYGITGVATVAAATMILQNGLMLISSKRKTGIWTHATFSPNFALGIIRQ